MTMDKQIETLAALVDCREHVFHNCAAGPLMRDDHQCLICGIAWTAPNRAFIKSISCNCPPENPQPYWWEDDG